MISRRSLLGLLGLSPVAAPMVAQAAVIEPIRIIDVSEAAPGQVFICGPNDRLVAIWHEGKSDMKLSSNMHDALDCIAYPHPFDDMLPHQTVGALMKRGLVEHAPVPCEEAQPTQALFFRMGVRQIVLTDKGREVMRESGRSPWRMDHADRMLTHHKKSIEDWERIKSAP